MEKTFTRDQVFVAGGQPSVTYVPRDDLGLEKNVKRAVEKPHFFTSISGASKTGKTVLCRTALADKQYIWVEGGQLTPLDNLWVKIAHDLEKPSSISVSQGSSRNLETTGGAKGKVKLPFFGEGGLSTELKHSRVREQLVLEKKSVDLKGSCIQHMIKHGIILVIDDFHYVPKDLQTELVRFLRGPVFNGLKVILLSVWYRAYEAISAEADIAGRLIHVNVPEWSPKDLAKIAKTGFGALNVKCPNRVIDELSAEANGSPQLMQSFCWELCFDRDISKTHASAVRVPSRLNLQEMYKRLSKEVAQSTYDSLSAGPQARSDRKQRPLKKGGTADIYQVVLAAIANTGPKNTIRFSEIRKNFAKLLSDGIPQQIEISNALKYLTDISTKISPTSRPIDWNEERKELVLAEPLFRFFLRWQLSDERKP